MNHHRPFKEWWKRPSCGDPGDGSEFTKPTPPSYSNDDIALIGASYRLCSDTVWPICFKERLEAIAWIYVYAQEEQKPATPSKTLEQLKGLRASIRKAAAILENADFRLQGELELAAKQVAETDGLPDFEADAIDYESIPPGNPITKKRWPVERQFRKSRQGIDYVLSICNVAIRRMQSEMKPSGPAPDEHLHEFVRAIDALYRETAADPRNPSYADRIRGDKGEGGRGELLGLLKATLNPLGIDNTSVGLLALWERATGNAGRRRRA